MGIPVERLLPILATSGAWIFASLFLLALVGIGVLGRGRRFLIPATWRGRALSVAFLALALVSGTLLYAVTGPLDPMLSQVRQVQGFVNRPAAEMSYRTVADDSQHRLSDLRGKVVVLNLWATWCGPCRHELPEIDKLQKAYAKQGLVAVTISTEERSDLLKFAAQYSYETLNVYAPHFEWLDVGGRPLTFIIDRQGVVRACFIGARSYAEFEHEVTKFMRT